MTEELFLSIVVPAYNEAHRLPDTLHNIAEYCLAATYPFEILIVSDGSTDDTALLVDKLGNKLQCLRLISYPVNRGKGYAVRTGIQQSRGKYILFSDADLSTPIEEFDRFLPLLQEGAQLVIATRKHQGANILKRQPWWRQSMGKAYTWISNFMLGLHITDFTCGFKAFQREAALKIFGSQRIERWAFDSEILFLANLYRYTILEVPVRWTNSPDTKVRILRDTIVSLLALFKIRWYESSGKYKKSPVTNKEIFPA